MKVQIIKTKLDQTKDMVLNRVLIVVMFVMTLGIVISLLRIPQTGFLFNYGVQLFLAAVIVFLFVARNKLVTKTKGIIFLGTLYVIALSGLLSFGLYGFGYIYFVPASAIAFLYFSKKTGWYITLSSLIVILIIGALFNRGVLSFIPDKEGYMQSTAMWLNMIITLSLISVVMTMFWSNMYNMLINTFTHIHYQQEDMKRINEQLTIARDNALQSDKLKSSFLQNISHEIRTPLNIIIGFSDMIGQTNNPDEQREFNEVIRENSNKMLKIVNDIVDFSKIETNTLSLNKTTFDVIEVLEDIKKNIAIDDNKSITFDINPISEIITADKDRFHQIIHNLIDNALKFTESGKIELNCHKNEKNLHFNVVDTGIGIPEGEHKRIFERFYKVDPFSSGAGLGLSLSQSIARFMGGNISVESVQGKGSTFEFVFPLK
jgi:signal transduction histidine kinase